MQLEHRFTVPAGLEETWVHFNDIEGVAGCFPGATVTEADAESFTGTVKVKLGPIALVYNGAGTFVAEDEAAHRLVIDAQGLHQVTGRPFKITQIEEKINELVRSKVTVA